MHELTSSEEGENSEYKETLSFCDTTDLNKLENSPIKVQLLSKESKILDNVRSEQQNHSLDKEEDSKEIFQLGNELVVERRELLDTVAKPLLSPLQDYSPSLKRVDFKCQIIREHIRHCGCLTPRLHIYLLNDHQCDSFCKTEEGTPTLATTNTFKIANQRLQKQSSLEIPESNLTDTEMTNMIKEEQITLNKDSSEMNILSQNTKECFCSSLSVKNGDKKSKKNSIFKIKESSFRFKKGNIPHHLIKGKLHGVKCSSKLSSKSKEPKLIFKSTKNSVSDAPKNISRKISPLIKRKRTNLQNDSYENSKAAITCTEVNSKKLSASQDKKKSINEVQVNLKSSISNNFTKKAVTCVQKEATNISIPACYSQIGYHIRENFKSLPVPEHDIDISDAHIKSYKTLPTSIDIKQATTVHRKEKDRNISVPKNNKIQEIARILAGSKSSSDKNASQFKYTTRKIPLDKCLTKKSATRLKEISRNLPLNKNLSKICATQAQNNCKSLLVTEYSDKRKIIHTKEIFMDPSLNKSTIKNIPIYTQENTANRLLSKNFSTKNATHATQICNGVSASKLITKNLPIKARKKVKKITLNEKGSVRKLDTKHPKKSKKLFQINKEGVFHSFSQNLIKISSVASLTSSRKANILSHKNTKNKESVKECKISTDNNNRNFIPPFELNLDIKSSPSDDEDTPDLIPSIYDTSLLPASLLKISAKDDKISTKDLEIKREPSAPVNVKSETVIEEFLNVEIDNDDTVDHDELSKLGQFNLEDKKSSSLWVSAPEKYPHFDGEGEMRCTLCLSSFTDFISLVGHLETHQRNGFILCYYCQKSFGDKTSMRRHMRTHTGEKPYQCKICEKRFSLPGNFKKHRDIHEDIRTEPCDICGKTFRRKEHLKYHRRTHTGEKPFKCTICGSCFTARYSLQIHMNIHLGKKPYKCSDCGKAFCDKSTMRKHIRVHTGERPFNCRVCHKSFGESGSLTAHAATHSQERPFLCSQCHLAFKTNGGLRQHIKTHIGDKQFSCKYCGMMFIQKYNMMMHERIHTGEKPYECSECHRTFRSRSCLGKHVILHGGDSERKYSCDHCEKKFFRKAHLKRHINTHLGIKEYGCSFCSKRFSTNGSLKKHLTTFHTEGARAFPCIVCGRTFKRSIYVATHKCLASLIKNEPSE